MVKRSLAKQDNRMPRAKTTASAILAVYASTEPGPERDAAIAALTAPEPRYREGIGRSHWDRATLRRRQG